MPLKVRDFGAREEDILTSSGGRFLFLDLEFHDVGRVLNDFRNISDMSRANFPENALPDPDHTTNEPIALWIECN